MGYKKEYATPQGNSGMTLVAENQDGGNFSLPIGFTVRYNAQDIKTAYSGGDSYVDFGIGTYAFYINKRDESLNKLFYQQSEKYGKKTFRIRFEGNSPYSPYGKNNLVWELTIFEDGVFMLVMDKLNTTAIGERKFYIPATKSTVELNLEEGKSYVFIPKDKDGVDYEIKEGSYIPLEVKYLVADELNYYTVEKNLLKKIPIAKDEKLTAEHFKKYGCEDVLGSLLVPLYNARVFLWSDEETVAKLTATATAFVNNQVLITNNADMSDKTIKGIRNVVCDVSSNSLVSMSWDDGFTWEYFNGTSWIVSDTDGMTAETLSAITTSQWSSYLATKTSKRYKFKFILSQSEKLKALKVNYVNYGG